MKMHDCDDLNVFRFDLINDPVRKAAQETSPSICNMFRPGLRHSYDTANAVFQLGKEVDAQFLIDHGIVSNCG